MPEERVYPLSVRRTVLLVATVSSFLSPFMTASINVALPAIQREFNMDAILLGWVPTALLVACAVAFLPMGRLSDIYGRKKVLIWGTVIITVASVIGACAMSGLMVIGARVLQGIGVGMSAGPSLAILAEVYPARERGKALGIALGAVYLGLALGPLCGGLLTRYLGWRSILFANVPIGVVLIACILLRLKPEWADSRGERFDLAGACLYGCVMLALAYGLTHLVSVTGLVALALTVACAAIFVRWETKVTMPVVDVHLFRRNKVFLCSNLAALIHYSATYAIAFLMSLYLQYLKGLSPDQAGFLLMSQPIIQSILTPLSGRFSDRIGPHLLAAGGMCLTGVSLLFFSFLTEATPVSVVLAVLALLGIGYALFVTPNTHAVMNSVETGDYGVASGMVSTSRTLGMMVSMSTVMLIFAFFLGRQVIAPHNYPLLLKAARVTFLLLACFCVGGVFASLVRSKEGGGGRAEA